MSYSMGPYLLDINGTYEEEEKEIACRLEDWYEDEMKEVAEIDRSTLRNVKVKLSKRLKRVHWKVRATGDGELVLKISKHSVDHNSIDDIMIYARQALLNFWHYSRYDRFDHESDAYQRVAEKLGVLESPGLSVRPPAYVVRCEDCNEVVARRQKKSKVVKHSYLYSCNECGGDLYVIEN